MRVSVSWEITIVLLSALALGGCGVGRSSILSTTGTLSGVDTAVSDVAIGLAAGASGHDDANSGIAMRSRSPLEWIAERLEFERAAYAAGYSCGTGTWTPSTGGTPTQTWVPPGCIVTYPNNAQVRLSWNGGPWNQTFSCTPATHFLVGSPSCGSGSTVLWSTSGSPITRAWVGPFEEGFIVTTDAGSGATSGWQTPQSAAGVLLTCTSTPCPPDNSGTGARTVDIGATTGAVHITGTINRQQFWDHTAYTTLLAPLAITGSGASRVITGGTIVVEDNLSQEVFTTTFNGPLTHMANCAFPVSGSVTTTIASTGPDNGVVETITFTSTCSVATLSRTDGTTSTLYLSLVL